MIPQTNLIIHSLALTLDSQNSSAQETKDLPASPVLRQLQVDSNILDNPNIDSVEQKFTISGKTTTFDCFTKAAFRLGKSSKSGDFTVDAFLPGECYARTPDGLYNIPKKGNRFFIPSSYNFGIKALMFFFGEKPIKDLINLSLKYYLVREIKGLYLESALKPIDKKAL